MPLIRPISDLRNRANEISELCHQEDRPVFITKQGKGDLVVMSQAHYERLLGLLELYQKLDLSEGNIEAEKGIKHRDMVRHLRSQIE